MANRIFGESRLTTEDGRELTLRFDFGALCEAEEAADAGTEEMVREMSKGSPRLKTARAMLYGALRFYHPELTLADAGDLLMTDGQTVSAALGRAMEEMADRRAGKSPPPGASGPPRGIGTPSSKSGRKAA